MSETLLFNCIVSSSVSTCGEKTAEDSWIEAKTGCRFVTGSPQLVRIIVGQIVIQLLRSLDYFYFYSKNFFFHKLKNNFIMIHN